MIYVDVHFTHTNIPTLNIKLDSKKLILKYNKKKALLRENIVNLL